MHITRLHPSGVPEVTHDVDRIEIRSALGALQLEIVEDPMVTGEVTIRVLGQGKLALVPSASNAVRVRTVRY